MKVGLIGCGGMGMTHILSLKALAENYNIEVIALADCREKFLKKAIEIWPLANQYISGIELIEKEDLDTLHICLPSYLHTEHAIAAMEKGIHVLIEKPVCLTKEDGQKLLETEKRTKVKVLVGQVLRCFEEYQYLKKIYDSKTYGNLKSIIMHRLSGNVNWGFNDWFHDEKKSGSSILDLHIHDADFLRYMIGEPDQLEVLSTSFDNGMINQVITSYQFGNTIAVTEGIWDISPSFPFEASYRACFEDATIVFNGVKKPSITVYHKDGSIETPELKFAYNVKNNKSGINISNLGPYYTEIKYFIECVQNNKPIELAPLSEGIKSVELVLKEFELAKKRQ